MRGRRNPIALKWTCICSMTAQIRPFHPPPRTPKQRKSEQLHRRWPRPANREIVGAINWCDAPDPWRGNTPTALHRTFRTPWHRFPTNAPTSDSSSLIRRQLGPSASPIAEWPEASPSQPSRMYRWNHRPRCHQPAGQPCLLNHLPRHLLPLPLPA